MQFLQICKFFLQILNVEHKSFLMMYHLSDLDIKHGILRGGGNLTPPSISWFSSTPAEILLPENAYDLSGSVQAVYVENHAYRCDFTIKNLEKFLWKCRKCFWTRSLAQNRKPQIENKTNYFLENISNFQQQTKCWKSREKRH